MPRYCTSVFWQSSPAGVCRLRASPQGPLAQKAQHKFFMQSSPAGVSPGLLALDLAVRALCLGGILRAFGARFRRELSNGLTGLLVGRVTGSWSSWIAEREPSERRRRGI